MTTYHVKAAACTGRGFVGTDANGYLKNFFDWVTGNPADGTPSLRGPGWFIIDNQSGAGSDPYIVVSDQSSPTPNSRARILRVQALNSTGSQVQITAFFYWDVATHTGRGLWALCNVPTVDSGLFAYDFRGGAEFMWLASFISGSLVFAALETWQALSDFKQADNVIGTLQSAFFKKTGDTGNLLDFSSVSGITYTSGNTDVNFELHASIVLISGSTYRIDLYKDAARTSPNLVAHTTSNFTNTTLGAKALTADNSSGVGGSIITLATVSANTAISCRFLKIDLGAGEGSLFQVNYSYILFDAQTSVIVSYMKVKAISGDVLTLEQYTAGKAFASGALFGAWPHRFFMLIQRDWNGTSVSSRIRHPYASVFANEYSDQTGASGGRNGDLLVETGILRPGLDHLGNYYDHSYIVMEHSAANSASFTNQPLGLTKNMKVTHTSGLSIYSFGRIIDGKNFLDVFHEAVGYNGMFQSLADLDTAMLVRDTAETT